MSVYDLSEILFFCKLAESAVQKSAEPKGCVTFDIFMPESNKNMILDSEGQKVVTIY